MHAPGYIGWGCAVVMTTCADDYGGSVDRRVCAWNSFAEEAWCVQAWLSNVSFPLGYSRLLSTFSGLSVAPLAGGPPLAP